MNHFSLAGTTAVVTGARRGIGFDMARGLAEAGADIVAVSAGLEEDSTIGRAVRDLGRDFRGFTCDFSDRKAVLALGEELAELRPDILVNNAGTIYRQPAIEHDLDQWDSVLEVNLSAPFILSQKLAPSMREQRWGKIIFTASLLSFQGGINVPSYTASKSAIAGVVRALANEWAGDGVNVNGIAPGYIETDNTAALRADPERFQAITARIPAVRWGKPQDLVGATVFLASHASDYVSGIVLPVDGGWLGR